MEMYKALNRELTIKNQELLQHKRALQFEMFDIRRRLIEERESHTTLKKSIISIITESFNHILCLMYDETDKQLITSSLAIGDLTQKRESGDKQKRRKSSHSNNSQGLNIQSPKGSSLANITNLKSPLVKVQKNSNITLRNRRAKQCEQDNTSPKEDNEEEANSSENIENQYEECDEYNGQSDEDMEYRPHEIPLPVVVEESSCIMDISHRPVRKFIYRPQSYAEDSEDTLLPNRSGDIQMSNHSRNEISVSRSGSGNYSKSVMNKTRDTVVEEPSPNNQRQEKIHRQQHLETLNVPDILLNESCFAKSMLKVLTSTPYKTGKVNNNEGDSLRNLRVLVPKLKLDSLSHLRVPYRSLEGSQPQPQEKDRDSPKASTSKAAKKKKHANKVSCQVQNVSISDTSNPSCRPKRKAAEVAKTHLVEPTIISKMRRET